MADPGLAAAERAALADLMERLGPQEPTLCAGWVTRDLAAHLVLREGRPDAALGIVLRPLAGHTARVQRSVAARPWPDLVAALRAGPPRWSPMRLATLTGGVEIAEFFVHHEDVRRARPGWRPRPADPERSAALWRLLVRMAGFAFRRCPVGVLLRRADDPGAPAHRARGGPGEVTLTGTPEELLLYAYGRDEVIIEFGGEPADVARLQGSARAV